nr:hypothetical protein [Pseudomonas sp. BIGb0427]
MNQDLPFSTLKLTDLSGLDDADLLPDYLRGDEIHSVEASRVHVPYMTPLVDHPDNLDGGITQALLQTSPHGLQVVVARYLQMAPGDAISVYWGDPEQPASPSPYIVRPEDLDKPDFFDCPATTCRADTGRYLRGLVSGPAVERQYSPVDALAGQGQASAAGWARPGSRYAGPPGLAATAGDPGLDRRGACPPGCRGIHFPLGEHGLGRRH